MFEKRREKTRQTRKSIGDLRIDVQKRTSKIEVSKRGMSLTPLESKSKKTTSNKKLPFKMELTENKKLKSKPICKSKFILNVKEVRSSMIKSPSTSNFRDWKEQKWDELQGEE